MGEDNDTSDGPARIKSPRCCVCNSYVEPHQIPNPKCSKCEDKALLRSIHAMLVDLVGRK